MSQPHEESVAPLARFGMIRHDFRRTKVGRGMRKWLEQKEMKGAEARTKILAVNGGLVLAVRDWLAALFISLICSPFLGIVLAWVSTNGNTNTAIGPAALEFCAGLHGWGRAAGWIRFDVRIYGLCRNPALGHARPVS